jgi:superfamily II DNA/RNA helicase
MSHILDFDVPFSPENDVHRIGRTGRAGKTGHSFTQASLVRSSHGYEPQPVA